MEQKTSKDFSSFLKTQNFGGCWELGRRREWGGGISWSKTEQLDRVHKELSRTKKNKLGTAKIQELEV